MNYTKEQILELALKTLKDINFECDRNIDIKNISFNESEKPPQGEFGDKEIPTWTATVEHGKLLFGESRSGFLIISDETGEPLYFQTSMVTLMEIEKDENGNYKRKE